MFSQLFRRRRQIFRSYPGVARAQPRSAQGRVSFLRLEFHSLVSLILVFIILVFIILMFMILFVELISRARYFYSFTYNLLTISVRDFQVCEHDPLLTYQHRDKSCLV